MTSAHFEEPKPHFRFRFGLRTLLIVMLLIGVVFGVLGTMAREARRQRKVVADLEAMGAYVAFSDEVPSIPELLDTGYCGRVIYIVFLSAEVTDVSPLAELKNLEGLSLKGTRVADLSALGELKNLEQLDLFGTPVSDQQVSELQQALPDCEIVR